MRANPRATCVLTVLLVAFGLATQAAETIPLDISAALNYDLWISSAEGAFAQSSNTLVSSIFGQHSIQTESNRSFAFQDQVGASHVGLPDDGAIAATLNDVQWNFQICTNRGIVPEGGYTDVDRPTVPNVVWRSTSGTPPVTNHIVLLASQQAKYASANFLFNSAGDATGTHARYVWIDALYDGGDRQRVFTVDWMLDAEYRKATGNSTNVVAYSCTRYWGQSGTRSDVRDGARYMHMFAEPLVLDEKKVLVGFDVICRANAVNRSNHFHLYSISALPAPGWSGSLLLVQ